MAFQAKTWGWKGLAARLLLVPVLAGSAVAVTYAQSGPADKARALVAQANQAMKSGDLAAAEKYAKQAQGLKAPLATDEPRPENVLAEIQKRKQTTTPMPGAAVAATGDPKELLKLARQALAAGQLDQAQDYANKANQAAAARGTRWGLLDDTPTSVNKEVLKAREKADKDKSEQLLKDAKVLFGKSVKTDVERMTNLENALNFAYQARQLHGPYSMWDFGDKPDKLITEIESAKAKLRKKMPADTIARNPSTTTPAKGTTAAPIQQVAGTSRPGEGSKVVTAAGTTGPKAPASFTPPATTPVAKAPAMPAAKATATPAPAPAPATAMAQPKPPAVNPAKAEVAKIVGEGRVLLVKEMVIEARAKATAARKLADEKGITSAAYGVNEDSPELLHQGCQTKGRMMIEALMKSANEMIAAKQYDKAEAALDYAQKLSDGLGLYSKPIVDQRAAVAKLAKPAVAQAPTTVAVQTTQVPATTLPAPAAPAVAQAAPPKSPVVPAAPTAPVMPSPIAPAVATAPAASVNLLDQAATELQRGDLKMAHDIAIKAHNATNDPAAKVQAQALLRQIEVEDFAVKQKNAKLALESGVAAHTAKRYENALAIFRQIEPTHLSAEQKGAMAKLMGDCLAQMTPAETEVKPAAAQQAPGVAKVGGDPKPAGDSLVDQQKALGEVAYQKLRQDGFEALNAANTAWGKGETDAALQALADYTARVKASTQSPSRQAMLLRPIEQRTEHLRLLKHHTDYLTKEAKDKSDVRRDMLAGNLAETQKQEEIKRKVKQVNELTKAHKFKEAESVAVQAKQLDPDDPTLSYIADQAKNRRRMEEAKDLRSDQEKLVLQGLNGAEQQGPYADVANPVVINPETMMRAIKRGDGDFYMRARTPAEMLIEQKLSAPYSFKFENATMRSVIDDIRKQTNMNITSDDAAIDDDKIKLEEVFVTEEVKDISLRDALTILLSKARLAFVVENNVVKVTTEKRSKGRMTTKVFHVMDLVTPIPEYRPAPHHRLDTAMEQARGTPPSALLGMMGGSTGSTPQIPTGGLQQGTMVSQQGAPGGGTTPWNLGGAGTIQNNLQSQPTAMTPQRVQYAEQLKKLITGMVRPYAWDTMAGPGKVEYYDVGGALIVSQTADVIREVQDLLESLRRLQDLSVAVEVRVISLSEAFFERVGVDFSMNIKTHNTTFERMLATSQFRPEPFLNDINNQNVVVGWNPASNGFTPDLDVPIRSTSYPLTMPPFGGYQGALSPTLNGGLSMGLAFLNDIQVYMFLEAAQGNRRVNVMQAPKITLFNGQTATVFVGDLAYFTTGLQVFNVGGQFVYIPQNTAFPVGNGINPNTGTPGGVSVTVQAVISADRRFVRLNLSPTLTALASATVPLFPLTTFITPVFEGGSQGQPIPFTQFFQQPSFSEIVAQTTVAVPDGGTVLLGGLKTLAQARNEFGPPVISQIPYLNRLFKNVGVGQETRHVMMMVTPRIIINSEEEARQVQEGGGLLPPQQ